VVLASAAAQAPLPEADKDFARGVRLQQAGDLGGACRAYDAALKLSPRRVDALSNLGLAYGGLHQYDRAIDAFEKALAIDPQQPTVLFNLGLTYLQTGQNEKARGALGTLVRKQSDNYLARHYLAVSLLKLGRIEEGITELETVASKHPEDLDAIYTLASAYIRNKQLEKARPLVEGAITRRENAEGHLITGTYYMATQDYRRALVELRRAQQLNPALPELGASLGGAYAVTGTGSLETATQMFEAHLQKNPSDFNTLAFLGWLYLESGRMADAEKFLNRALQIRPGDLDVMLHLARIARAKENYDEAAKLLEQVVAAKPDHKQAHVLLALTYFRLKRMDDGNREQEIVRRLN